ncbi:hypothetical protein [Yersinia ruckeri]|uniref:hypothetical protein n=1 Tax=Yersinia ruckeri TaxID=29486 RepID=UPI001F249437|nr:hypothetical protein [Yersinia ruckeri]UIM99577.1 hypothetical protein LGL91_10340 [Yersinia ruckeri]
MKLSIHGISKGDKHVKAFANIDFISCILGMDMSTPCCRLEVSVPYKEGKALEQYETELTAKAKEHITEMYKEIVCGGEMDNEIVIGIQGKCASGYNVKVISKNGKLCTASGDDSLLKPTPKELAERIENLEKSVSNSAGI